MSPVEKNSIKTFLSNENMYKCFGIHNFKIIHDEKRVLYDKKKERDDSRRDLLNGNKDVHVYSFYE